MEQIFLKTARQEVDRKYVGFQPNSGSVKPVHIASGAQRCIYGSFKRSKSIKRMALVSDSKGNVPKGNEAETIYDQLAENEVIEDNIALNSVESMRNVMQRLLSVDKGVFVVSALKELSQSAAFCASRVIFAPEIFHTRFSVSPVRETAQVSSP